jgi:iron complex transport system permease protein
MTDTSVKSAGAIADVLLTEEQVLTGHARLIRRRGWILIVLAFVVIAAFCADVVTGPSSLTALQTLQGILSPETLSRPMAVVIWDVRLAYAVMALLVGMALALAGAEMQTILDNPLASPFTLGVSSAAALGAAFAIVLGFGLPMVPQSWLIPVNAFLFAVGSIAAIQFLSQLRGSGAETIVLFGIAIMFAANAGIALLQFTASSQTLQQLVFWMLGGLTRTDWSRITILGVVLVLIAPFSARAASRLNALRFGEDRARTFGVDVDRLRLTSLLRISILTATAVSFVGTIAFVGLVGPHMARLLVGEDHRYFLPASALAGALVMSAASIASKLVVPGVIVPVGVVTSIVGVPVFVLLILTGRRRA